jgi:hypothetical protein
LPLLSWCAFPDLNWQGWDLLTGDDVFRKMALVRKETDARRVAPRFSARS